MGKIPITTFNNGQKYPVFGLGTFRSEPGKVTQVVKDAIDLGYRHFDCAYVYQNEKEIGAAIAAKIADGVVKREDLFITSKLWNTFHKQEDVESGLQLSLQYLGLDYLDLYLIHWPFAFEEGDELVPRGPDGKVIFADYDYVDTWKGMEAVQKAGLAKSIGISNFNKEQIERLLETAEIVPVVNQIECSPLLNQKKLSTLCLSKGIKIVAYSPLGSGDATLLANPRFKDIASKYKKTVPQVLIKYQLQRGHLVIPKSVTKARLAQNINVFDFTLWPEDMEYLNTIDRNHRTVKFEPAVEHKYYAFHAEY